MTGQADGLQPIVLALAERLWAVQRGDAAVTRLILPTKRNLLARVSEQESKVLLCGVLEESDWYYSVETPTRQTYVQKGKTPQSARCDLSLYRTSSPASLAVNIELKAHNPGVEAFRKDFEKLLRERADGLWVHTLLKSDAITVASVFNKMRKAFETERQHIGGTARTLTFAFVGLETQDLALVSFEVGGDTDEASQRVGSVLDPEAVDAGQHGWQVFARTDSGTGKAERFTHGVSRRPVGDGLRASQLVYAPDIDASTFLHLSVRGNSYFLRRFKAGRVDKFRAPGASDFPSLLDGYAFIVSETTTPDDRKHNIDTDVSYWEGRIAGLNAGLSPQQDT